MKTMRSRLIASAALIFIAGVLSANLQPIDGGRGATVAPREAVVDIRTQARLGQYYAAKIRGTVALGLFRKTGEGRYQTDAVAHLKKALGTWRLYAQELDANYTNKLFISGQRVFDWFDESGPQLDISIAEKAVPGETPAAPKKG